MARSGTMSRVAQRTANSRATYWAAEPDAKRFAGSLLRKIDDFREVYSSTHLGQRLIRSWKYYHSLFYSGQGGDMTEIKYLGPDGEYALISVGEFRSLIRNLLQMTTRNRPAYSVQAKNTENASLLQARLGKGLLDAYMRDKKLEEKMRRAVEHALVFNVGYLYTRWEFGLSTGVPEPSQMDMAIEDGDIMYSTPSIMDVVVDPAMEEWDPQWVLIRTWPNRYDVAERYPEMWDYLVNYQDSDRSEEIATFSWIKRENTDRIPRWEFYHIPSAAIPGGRYAAMVGDRLLPGHEALPNPYGDIPLERVTAGEMLLTIFGHSPAIEAQGLQEAANAEMSMIISNHKNLGEGKVWLEYGDEPQYRTMAEGLGVMHSRKPPQALELLATPPEVLQMPQVISGILEKITGVYSVRRGDLGGKELSGAALALLDAKSVEANSELMASYANLIEGVGVRTLKYLDIFATTPRRVSILGANNIYYDAEIQAGSFSMIDRVIVQSGNPLLNTTAGRMELANIISAMPGATMEEMLTFIQTGNLEPLMELRNSQASLARSENEAMLRGEPSHQALAWDDHIFHIKTHLSLIATPLARQNRLLMALVAASVQEHTWHLLANPNAMILQQMLGYQGAQFGMAAMMPGAPGGPTGAIEPPFQGMASPNQDQARPPRQPRAADERTQSGAETSGV